MKKLFYAVLFAIVITGSAFTIATTQSWKLKDENYTVKFTSPSVEGVFKGLKTEIHFDENNLAGSSITASIESGTVNTGNGMRNKHAKEGLGAPQYPTINFTSTSIVKSASGYTANGKLTIKDVTKDIQMPFTFTKSGDGGTFNGSFTVVTADYKIVRKGTPESVVINLDVPVIK
jgi:polyisoprenoid-binding protein YceI